MAEQEGCSIKQLSGLTQRYFYCDDPIVVVPDEHEIEKITEHLDAISNAGLMQTFKSGGLCEWHRNYFASEGVIPS